MELVRNALKELENWRQLKNRKPLLIRGARQVGKTTLVKQFSRQFDQYIELNLEKRAERQLFDQTDNIDELLSAIFLYKEIPFSKIPTLLFIDEIQESPEAISMLRFFYEEKPEIFVIAAGSLLEFSLRKIPSFPVGRLSYLTLHPLNFCEFLGAINKEAQSIYHEIPVPAYAHRQLMKLFHSYATIGGMPEIVKSFIEDKNIAALLPVYKDLWQAYKDDVEKYSDSQSDRKVIRHVIDAAPKETDRIKFEGFGNSNYRSREIGEALRTLDMAKIIRLVYPSTSLNPPLTINYRKRPKLQFLDTGLLINALLLHGKMIAISDLNHLYRGRIIQQLVSQELTSVHSDPDFRPHFWVREKKGSDAEVDLVLQYGRYIIPIEIKSGEKGTLKSLHQFIDMAEHPYALRLYAGPMKTEKAVTPTGKPYVLHNLPYYLGAKLPQYLNTLLK